MNSGEYLTDKRELWSFVKQKQKNLNIIVKLESSIWSRFSYQDSSLIVWLWACSESTWRLSVTEHRSTITLPLLKRIKQWKMCEERFMMLVPTCSTVWWRPTQTVSLTWWCEENKSVTAHSVWKALIWMLETLLLLWSLYPAPDIRDEMSLLRRNTLTKSSCFVMRR